MTFRETIKNISVFYEKFDATFKKIDDLLQETTDNGGKKDDSINNVVNNLADFQSSCYKDKILSKENPQEYVKIYEHIKKIPNVGGEIEEYKRIIKDLQHVVRNSLISDTDWQGQQLCIQIIDSILDSLKLITACSNEQTASYYAAVRILRELVADCSITICALQPLSIWNYGTTEYAQLNAEEQLLVLVNQAILIDRMYFCLYSLEITLDRLDKAISSFQKLDWNVYYVAGFLNFKIHKYTIAREYFEKVVFNKNLKGTRNEETENLYFRAMLFIAYSYEYSGDFGFAIEQLVSSPVEINNILKEYSLSSINSNITEIMNRICKISSPDTLIYNYIESFSVFCENAKLNSEENKRQLEIQFEILHALGHCLNEYAIKHKKIATKNTANGSINYGKMLCLARRIMYELAQFRHEYLTCYATIHGEYQDYHQALVELDIAEREYSKEGEFYGKETLNAEVNFFKYYFGLLCNQMFEDDKKQFEQYYFKYDDDDAECYLKIFEFRNELRKYLATLYSDIRNVDDSFSESNLSPISNNLIQKYEGLCRLNPTLYMNVNVRAELRLIQRAYICVNKLREYLIDPSPVKLLDLRNASYRFLCVKRDFSLTSIELDDSLKEKLPQDDNYDDNHVVKDYKDLPAIVSQAFLTGKASVLECLFNTDSIFILAPISGVVVFQYQTGTIGKLFNLDDKIVIPHLDGLIQSPINEVANALFEIYSEMSAHYDQRKLANIKWNRLIEYTSVIYYWDSDVPSQVIVTKSNSLDHIRQIVDVDAFSKTLEEIKYKFYGTERKRCRDQKRYHNVRCTLQSVYLPWMEVINEEAEDKEFFIVWDDDKNFKCYIIPFSAKIRDSRHAFHAIIREISIEYDSGELILDPEDVDAPGFDNSQLCKNIRPLISIKKNRVLQNIASLEKRIKAFENDTHNDNVILLMNKKTKEYEQLKKIAEIEKRLNEEYKNSTFRQVKEDFLYLEDL